MSVIKKTKYVTPPVKSWGRHAAITVVAISSAFLMAACGKVEKRWKEEARLHDDRIVLIDRYSISARSGFPNSGIGNVLYQEIHYAPAGFSWSTPATEQPLSFDVMEGDVYFVTIPVEGLAQFCLGKPKGTYQANFYRWKKGQMERLSQQQAPLDRLHKNISGVSQGPHSENIAYLSVGDVNKANGTLSYAPQPTLRQVFEEEQKYYLLCP